MRKTQFIALIATVLLFAACATTTKIPELGKVTEGYLVNVDDKGVILQGHDPVSLLEGKDVAGSVANSTKYHGATYYFVTAENKKKFDANPVKYEPQFGGYCSYGLAVGKLAPIELWTYDTTYQHLNIYQHNQKAVNGWKTDVPGNYIKAQKQWAKFQKQFNAKKHS